MTTFFSYLKLCFAWLPASWQLLIKAALLFFLIWALVRLIAHILDAIPFL